MKIFTSIWMVIAFAVVLTGIRIDNSDTVKTMRYQTWDHFQYVQPRQEVSDTDSCGRHHRRRFKEIRTMAMAQTHNGRVPCQL